MERNMLKKSKAVMANEFCRCKNRETEIKKRKITLETKKNAFELNYFLFLAVKKLSIP
jgi:hypothetical protein